MTTTVDSEEEDAGKKRETLLLAMSISNQTFGIPRKYQNQIGLWYFCPKFLGIFLVFYRYFEIALVYLVKYWYFSAM